MIIGGDAEADPTTENMQYVFSMLGGSCDNVVGTAFALHLNGALPYADSTEIVPVRIGYHVIHAPRD